MMTEWVTRVEMSTPVEQQTLAPLGDQATSAATPVVTDTSDSKLRD